MLNNLFDVFRAALALAIAFAVGFVARDGEFLKLQVLRDAVTGLQAVRFQVSLPDNPYETWLWQEGPATNAGVTRIDPKRAAPGYTLYTSTAEHAAFLVDQQGNLTHKWARRLDAIPGLLDGRPEAERWLARQDFIYYRASRAFANGDLLALVVVFGETPWAIGAVMLDKNSDVRWVTQYRTHHDIDVGPDGNIYLLSQEILASPPRGQEYLQRPLFDDGVLVLDRSGNELRHVSLLKAIRNSEYAHILFDAHDPRGDLLHTNTIDVVTPGQAELFPFLATGQVVVNFRNLDFMAAVDLDSEEITWALAGPWRQSHDPDLLDNGRILMFDNLSIPGWSRVIELDPQTQVINWQYRGTPEDPLRSDTLARQQRLANGNTLITSSLQARLVEVTPDHQVVWEYFHPNHTRHNGRNWIPVLTGGNRYTLEELPFLNDQPAGSDAF